LVIINENNNKNLGYLKELDVFFKLVDWNGLQILDIGCGNGELPIAFSSRGGNVIGIESDPIQAKKNSTHDIINVQFLYGSGHEIPFENNSFDSVVFSKSLHHVPVELMDKSIFEAIRVLRNNGFLFVLEPDVKGTFFELIRPFHDETYVRNQAIIALNNVANNYFKNLQEFYFTSKYSFKDFETFVNKMSSTTFNNISKESINNDKVNQIFKKGHYKDGYYFENRMIVRIYKNKKYDG